MKRTLRALAVMAWGLGVVAAAVGPVEAEAQVITPCLECDPCFLGVDCARSEICAGTFFAKVCVTQVYRYPEAA